MKSNFKMINWMNKQITLNNQRLMSKRDKNHKNMIN